MTDAPQGGHEPCSDDAARLRARNLTVRYHDKTVVDIPDLTLETGITALTGPNGAGKSTLLKVFAGLAGQTSGTITLGSDTGTKRVGSLYRAAIGYLPQEPGFPGHFTVTEAVTYSAWLRGIPRARRLEAVERIIEELALAKVASMKLKELSGGNRQRAYIAQAVVHQPSVLLLDEPTTGIDVEHRIELRRHLGSLGAKCCVVMSTHHTEDIELLAGRVISLREGRVVFDGTPAELIARVEGTSREEHRASREARSIEQALQELGGSA
ncbi:ABC transporter ATP-binding protein [Streptomyces sp. NPDC002779]|uniref:ABC transporter ATP-binding protein n=1 Tax=Streptomyces sp. NPDC002779 TaxID=3364664 RepID=UPI0036CF2F13